jgi:hypothetical protein
VAHKDNPTYYDDCVALGKNKGKKVDERQPQLSPYLKNSTKTYFLLLKSPKKKVCYILPPTVFGTFFERRKVV